MGNFQRIEIQPDITGPEKPAAPEKGALPDTKGETPQRPDYLPEKFWKDGKADYEGLAKSYVELERTRTGEAPKIQEKPEETKPNGEPPQAPGAIPGVAVESAQRYAQELQKDGKLSEQSYAELAKAGYQKATVDAYVKGVQADQAAATAQASEIKKLAGGDEGYAAMVGWAASALSPAEIAAFDSIVSTGSAEQIKLAVEALHTRYTKATGTDPRLIGGRQGAPVSGDIFESHAQVSLAMRDPRYKSDPAYRAKVAEKLKRSTAI